MTSFFAQRTVRVALAGAATLGLAACAGSGSGDTALRSTDSVTVVEGMADLPTPTGTDVAATRTGYAVGPLDQLVIDVYGMEGLSNREVTVDAMGQLSFPLAGTLSVAGLTPEDVARQITARMRENYVRQPQVTVNLKVANSQVVTVDGQVQRPGVYPVIAPMTLTRAVASAQGLAEFAKADDVVVMRTVDGRRYAALYNLAAIRRGVYADPQIYASDLVVVGESTQRRLFRDLLQVAPLLTTPLVLLLQN